MADEQPEVKELTAEESLAIVEAQVEKLDDAEKLAGKNVLSYVQKRLIEVSMQRVKASEARYMLEIWLVPPEPGRIWRTIMTFLWLNGETMGPGGDQLIHECSYPGCNGMFEPPIKSFIVGTKQAVLCESCKRISFKASLADSRHCTGTWDILAQHVAKRFLQLHSNADVFKRVFHESEIPHLEGVIRGGYGAVDKYMKAQNHKDHVYYLNKDILRDSAGCTDLSRFFKGFLKA